MKTPVHKVERIAARFGRILLVMLVAFSLYTPKSAHAQTLADLQAAFGGAPGALFGAMGYPYAPPFDPTALTGPVPPGAVNGYDINVMLAAMANTLGAAAPGGCVPTCMAAALAQVNLAIGGDATALSLLQNTIGPTFWVNYINSNPTWTNFCFICDGSDDFWVPTYFRNPDVYGRVVNPLSSGFALMFAGAGNQATQTIYNAMCNGDAGAIDVLNALLYNRLTSPPTPYTGASAATFLQSMMQGLTGIPPSLGAACTILTQALAGDPNANSGINLVIATILYTNQIILPPLYNASSINWMMTVPVTPTGLTGNPPSILVNPPIPPLPPPGPIPIPPPPPPVPIPPQPPIPPAPPLPPSPPIPPAPPPSSPPAPPPSPPPVGGALPVLNSAPTNGCGSGNASLTGTFGYNSGDPCVETEALLQMTNDTTYWDVAGEQFVDHVNDWFDNQMLPAMKDMTTQLSASVVDQSRQMGTAMDSHNMSKNARMLQDKELDEKKRVMPNEHSCVPASSVHAQSRTLSSSNAIEAGFRFSGNQRTGNAPGSPGAISPANDQQSRWSEFCTYFLDVDANNGWNACPGQAPSAPAADRLANGDIDIEGVLLVDSIDLAQPEQYHAVQAIMQNLVQPRVWEQLPDNILLAPTAQELILMREHIKAIQNIAYDVVGGIISRRAAIKMNAGDEVDTKIKEIRERAGVDLQKIAWSGNTDANWPKQPSYNEIMLALTKERFMDPEYYARMANDIGALQQEQTSINAYTTITLQDIYKLQEQINALLAARAAIKFEREKADPRQEITPVR